MKLLFTITLYHAPGKILTRRRVSPRNLKSALKRAEKYAQYCIQNSRKRDLMFRQIKQINIVLGNTRRNLNTNNIFEAITDSNGDLISIRDHYKENHK